MTLRVVFLHVAIAMLASVAVADTRRTTEAVTLRAKPGERQAAVVTVPVGAVVTVLEEHGRWIRVRVGKARKAKVGWVTRTTLAAPAAATSATPADPTAPDAAWTARESSVAPVSPAAKAVARAGGAPPGSPPARLAVRATVGIGYRSLDMRFASNGGGGLANYLVSADAAVADVEAELIARPRSRLVLAAIDGRVRMSYSSPGLDYMGPTLPAGEIPFTVFEAEAGARLGVHHGAFDAALRGGLHYGAFLAEEIANAGRLPRERLFGATAGVRADIAPARSRVVVSLAFDLLVAGDRQQTPGLEDGQTSDAGALWTSATVRYRLDQRWSALGTLSFTRATTSWRGPSVRQPDVTAADRVDRSEIVQVGVAAEL